MILANIYLQLSLEFITHFFQKLANIIIHKLNISKFSPKIQFNTSYSPLLPTQEFHVRVPGRSENRRIRRADKLFTVVAGASPMSTGKLSRSRPPSNGKPRTRTWIAFTICFPSPWNRDWSISNANFHF